MVCGPYGTLRPLSPFPLRTHCGAGAQVNIRNGERHHLPGPGTALGHEPHQRLVTTVPHLGAGAGGDERTQLLVGERLHNLVVQLR